METTVILPDSLRLGDVIAEFDNQGRVSRRIPVKELTPCGNHRPGVHVNGNMCYNTPTNPVHILAR
jgi:hypothetical protein